MICPVSTEPKRFSQIGQDAGAADQEPEIALWREERVLGVLAISSAPWPSNAGPNHVPCVLDHPGIAKPLTALFAYAVLVVGIQ